MRFSIYTKLLVLDTLSNNSSNSFWSRILLRQNLIKWSLGHQDIVIPGEFVFHVTQYFTRNQQQKDKKTLCVGVIHAKSGRYLRYISAIFFGFSAKFQAENAKSILHPSHRLRQHHLRWRQHHIRWRQHHFRWKQHHFLSTFTIFGRFSPFFMSFTIYALLSRFTFFRDLRTFSAIFFRQKYPSSQHHTFFARMLAPY